MSNPTSNPTSNPANSPRAQTAAEWLLHQLDLPTVERTLRRVDGQAVLRVLHRPDLQIALALALLTVTLRIIAYTRAYDVYLDEYFYQRMGASVAAGHLPPGDGQDMFVLHPPGFFVLEALWQHLTSPPATQFDQVMAMRQLQILLATVTALGLFLLLRPITGRATAAIAVAAYAVDPFVLRQNGRVLLETATAAFVVLGWIPILRVVRAPGRRRQAVALASGGTVLGCATATKDVGLFLTTVPLLVMLTFRWGLTRRQAAVTILASLLPYALFVFSVVVQGGAAQLWEAKTAGLSRLLGLTVTTGYNLAGAPSLLDVALTQVTGFVPSYVTMAMGALAGFWLMWRGRRPEHRIIGATTTSGTALVGYGTMFATSEEHLFYFVLVPALLSLTITLRLAVTSPRRLSPPKRRSRTAGHRERGDRARRCFVGTLAVALLSTGVADLVVWSHTRTTPDDGQRRLVAWIQQNVPAGSTLAFVAGQTEFQLAGTPWHAVPVDTPATMARARVRYLVVLQKEVEQRYSSASPLEVAWLTARGREVFAFVGPSYGRISIYETLDPSVW